jgi:hypothetical protein
MTQILRLITICLLIQLLPGDIEAQTMHTSFRAPGASPSHSGLHTRGSEHANPHNDGAPVPFHIRGVLPWHNFLSGPSAWNLDDYRKYLDDCRRMEINFIGFHNYTGGGQRYVTYVEPMIKIAYKGIVPDAYLDNSLTARWGYTPLSTKDFAFNTGSLFTPGEGAFGADCSILSRNKSEHYRRTQTLMQKVVAMAHARGIQVAMGFEFGVHPPEFFSLMEDGLYWEGTGTLVPNPTHYQAIEILHATIDNILETYPEIDWIWLWLNEHSFFGFDAGMALKNETFKKTYDEYSALFEDPGITPTQKLIGVWSLTYIKEACDYIKRTAPHKNIVLGGWGGSDQLPAILKGLDKGLPTDIVFSCLNPGLGQYPQPALFAEIARHRRFWSIPWLEGDHQLWHYQARLHTVREQVKRAREMNHDGVIAIHWRTEETRANLECYSRFAANPMDTATVAELYREFLLKSCGMVAAEELSRQFSQLDEEMWLRNASSPEYYAYTPDWGRLDSTDNGRIRNLVGLIESARNRTSGKTNVRNLDWFKANLEFALLLDEVGVKLEPAYMLRKRFYDASFNLKAERERIRFARESLNEAPLKRLFEVFASRVRSRGELGELSSLNQKLFNEYKGLERFLSKIEAHLE